MHNNILVSRFVSFIFGYLKANALVWVFTPMILVAVTISLVFFFQIFGSTLPGDMEKSIFLYAIKFFTGVSESGNYSAGDFVPHFLKIVGIIGVAFFLMIEFLKHLKLLPRRTTFKKIAKNILIFFSIFFVVAIIGDIIVGESLGRIGTWLLWFFVFWIAAMFGAASWWLLDVIQRFFQEDLKTLEN